MSVVRFGGFCDQRFPLLRKLGDVEAKVLTYSNFEVVQVHVFVSMSHQRFQNIMVGQSKWISTWI